MGRRGWAILIGLVILGIDALSKVLVHQYLPHIADAGPHFPYGGIGVFQNFFGIDFAIGHMTNKGAAWGAFGQYQNLLLGVRLIMVTGLLAYFFVGCKKVSYLLPVMLIISGAVGNIIDTFVYGHVVDMIGFRFWGYQYPWFNIADTSIFIGIAWLAILTLRQPSAATHEST